MGGGGVDWRHLAVLLAVQLLEAVNISIMYAMSVLMVRDFGVAAREADEGYWVGLLAAAFCLGEGMLAEQWGRLSDRVGTRSAVAVSSALAALGSVALGLAPSYPAAVAARLAAGMCNGTAVIAKAFLGRQLRGDEAAATRAFSLLQVAWGAGNVAGPALGGLLAEHRFLGHDFLLPMAVATAMQLGVLAAALLALPSRAAEGEASEAVDVQIVSTSPLPRAVALVAGIYVCAGVIFTIQDETLALVLVEEYEFGATTMGLVLAGTGLQLFLYTLWLHPRVARRLGSAGGLRAGLWMVPPMACGLQLGAQVLPLRWPVLFSSLWLRAQSATMCFTSLMVLSNEAAPPGRVGEVNGLVGRWLALARGFSPVMGGAVWAWSASQGFWGRQLAVAGVLSSVAVLGVWLLARFGRAAAASSGSADSGGGLASSGEGLAPSGVGARELALV